MQILFRIRFFLIKLLIIALFLSSATNCYSFKPKSISVGANQTDEYLPLLKNKKVALVVNQTSIIGNHRNKFHLVDSLLKLNVKIVKIFAPEHGFRGTADAGEHVKDGKDAKTKLPIISLYGSNRKPKAEQLEGIDVVIFDIQDVGTRFYTYISTMSLVMEACAEAEIPVLVLDRPNPNGFYIDGPILEYPKYSTFVGMHPVPVVHGMTIGEYAKMVNGEAWLKNGIQCNLTVISCKNYMRNIPYKLPVKPSPNLPNMTAIYLYPSLCFFEGTDISVGRGTDKPFQVIGHPSFKKAEYFFTPKSMPGAKSPKHQDQVCGGMDLSELRKEFFYERQAIDLSALINYYQQFEPKTDYFTNYFDKLAGTNSLRLMIIEGKTESEIRNSWKRGIERFIVLRKKYLIYPDIDHNQYLMKD